MYTDVMLSECLQSVVHVLANQGRKHNFAPEEFPHILGEISSFTGPYPLWDQFLCFFKEQFFPQP